MSEVNRHIEEIEKKLKPIIDLFKHSDYAKKELNKNEPEFRVGDWIIHKDNKHITIKIIEKIGMYYRTVDTVNYYHNIYISYINENYRLWTIQDAKDGDVLATKDTVFIFKHLDKTGLSLCKSYCEVIGNSELGLGFDFSINSVYPATAEQRDLLFQKMHEAGYEWDYDKKELKKINDKFDFTKLKAFTPVLARTGDHQTWFPHFFESYHPDNHGGEFYMLDEQHTLIRYSQCVPYEGNEKLLKTQDPIPPFYDIRKK